MVLAGLLLLLPEEALESVGAEAGWERQTIRFLAIFLAFHGLVTLSARRVPGLGGGDAVINRFAAAVVIMAGLYLLSGNGLFLVLAFSVTIGMTLNRLMKRLDHAFERIQDQLEWRIPIGL